MLKLFVCSRSESIGKYIDSDFIAPGYKCVQFSDGELEVHFEESVRGEDVYLLQSLTSSDSIIELMMAVNAAKLGSAKTITAVIPYMGYARQDRKSYPRVSLGAKVILKTLESLGVDRIITIDLHAPQEVGFVDIPVDHLRSTAIFMPDMVPGENAVFVAPDAGSSKLVSLYAKYYHRPMILCHKVRLEANKVDSMMVIGDVQDKACIIIDDMCDTASTLVKCANELHNRGAVAITAVFTHPVLSGNALLNLSDSYIDNIITTNTTSNALRLEGLTNKYFKYIKVQIHSVTPLLLNAIQASYENKSIESLYVINQ